MLSSKSFNNIKGVINHALYVIIYNVIASHNIKSYFEIQVIEFEHFICRRHCRKPRQENV
jgi:hypothetical protein